MMENDAKMRITVTVSSSLHEELAEMKKENGLSVDKNAAKLIEKGMKELKRKRKNAKEDNSSDNA